MIKTHSVTAREKIRKARKLAGGRTHSLEHRMALRRYNAGGIATSKPIRQYSKAKEIIREWPSMMAAAKELGLSKGNIGMAATKKKHQKIGGFFWRYVADDDLCKN